MGSGGASFYRGWVGVWTVMRGGLLTVVGPKHCPNLHPLRYPNLLQGADVEQGWFLCRTCGLMIHRLHRERTQWVTDHSHAVVEVEGFDPHPDTMDGVMLTDRISPA